jgi:hypothetical protein
MKAFHNKEKLKEFMTTKPALQDTSRSFTHRRNKSETGRFKRE